MDELREARCVHSCFIAIHCNVNTSPKSLNVGLHLSVETHTVEVAIGDRDSPCFYVEVNLDSSFYVKGTRLCRFLDL